MEKNKIGKTERETIAWTLTQFIVDRHKDWSIHITCNTSGRIVTIINKTHGIMIDAVRTTPFYADDVYAVKIDGNWVKIQDADLSRVVHDLFKFLKGQRDNKGLDNLLGQLSRAYAKII